ncbi:SDR family NAD(P)-dependent oxidoreductase [Sphingobium phenoxybenzoativorans]|uniref:SDR family NAD(P)-dependent oxidoreductase n=1 Tax=Sphingobium phenoxybenzoativorans TaxID=1592790 RepID=UPI0008724D82|nr:SDR family oxidoreductase [Sphingobium phenoxybenzoativorans]
MSGAVLISGAATGIGAQIAIYLADKGYDVIAFGLDTDLPMNIEAPGRGTLKEWSTARSLPVTVVEADVTSPDEIDAVIALAMAEHGRIHALVNNAAVRWLGSVPDTSFERFQQTLAVNLGGAFLCSKAVLPVMTASGGGAIVHIGSGAGWGKANMAAYAASKGGLIALSASIAYDHFHDHVRSNIVIPGGGLMSGMIASSPEESARIRASMPGTAAGRPADGADIGAAIEFLISPAGATISGAVLDVGSFFHQGGPLPPHPSASANKGS